MKESIWEWGRRARIQAQRVRENRSQNGAGGSRKDLCLPIQCHLQHFQLKMTFKSLHAQVVFQQQKETHY